MEFNKNVIISKSSNDFTLIYDGIDTYYLYYKEKEVMSLTSRDKPKDLDKNTFGLTHKDLTNFKGHDNYSELTDSIIKQIQKEIKIPNTQILTLKNICGQLYKAQKDENTLINNFNNSPTAIQNKIISLSELYGNDNKNDTITISDDASIEPQTIEEVIEARRNPVLTIKEKEIVKQVKSDIKKDGLIKHLNSILDDVHIGEHRNILRKTLMEFTIMRGKGSFLSETVANAEEGKSFEDEIVFEIITPPRYIFKQNDMTKSAFTRLGDLSPFYYDRLTILFGDFGSKNSFDEIKFVFDVFKKLITEKEYSRSLSEQEEKGYEVISIDLNVDSVGAVYSTTLNSFTKDDNQLISRTLNSTPAPTDKGNIIDLIDVLEFSGTKQSKARKKAIEKLRAFGIYMMSLVNSDTEIINPYGSVFKEYALKSENPIREFKQQKELFNSYCNLTNHECITLENYKIASLNQLMDFMNDINLENALIPYENDFLKMLLAKGNKTELTMVRDVDYEELIKDTEQMEDLPKDIKEYRINEINKEMARDDIISIIECENNVFEIMGVYREELTQLQKKEIPNKMLLLYGLRGKSSEHKDERVFFRVSDLRNIYGSRRAYKNIDNVPKLLDSLFKKGYLGKYEHKQENENLYYLTTKCDDIISEFEPTKTFDEYWKEYKEKTGL